MATSLAETVASVKTSGKFDLVLGPSQLASPDASLGLTLWELKCRKYHDGGLPEDPRVTVTATAIRIEVLNLGMPDESSKMLRDETRNAPPDPTAAHRAAIGATLQANPRLLGALDTAVGERAGFVKFIANDGPGPFIEVWAIWRANGNSWQLAKMAPQPEIRPL